MHRAWHQNCYQESRGRRLRNWEHRISTICISSKRNIQAWESCWEIQNKGSERWRTCHPTYDCQWWVWEWPSPASYTSTVCTTTARKGHNRGEWRSVSIYNISTLIRKYNIHHIYKITYLILLTRKPSSRASAISQLYKRDGQNIQCNGRKSAETWR